MRKLSPRQLQVLECLSQGDPNKIISRKLGITDGTTKVVVRTLMNKLGTRNRTELAVWYLEQQG